MDAKTTGLTESPSKELISREFPRDASEVTYLNTGSCGRKPHSVLSTLQKSWLALNDNPTLTTFIETAAIERARKSASKMLGVDPATLLLTPNTTYGLQMVLSSFLLKAGDELVTTDHEHGSLYVIARYLEDTRGITVRKYNVNAFDDSEQHSLGILNSVTERTKLVAVSEIDCMTGWRPDLSLLQQGVQMLDVPLLVDGAHSPGQGPCDPSKYSLWVGSGHKWLGGPNGTGFLVAQRDWIPRLEPVAIGDRYYEKLDEDSFDLGRFEAVGTTDTAKWEGLATACDLHMELTPEAVASTQLKLMKYLRGRLQEFLRPHYRIPDRTEAEVNESTGLLAFYFDKDRVGTSDIRGWLWNKHKIWVQPDYLGSNPGYGMRVSCHISNTTEDIDKLVDALKEIIAPP